MKTASFSLLVLIIFAGFSAKSDAQNPKTSTRLPDRYYSSAIHCVVRDKAGRPLQGVYLIHERITAQIPSRYALPPTHLVIQRSPTNSRGEFVFQHLIPGGYALNLADASVRKGVFVSAHQTATIIFTLRERPWHFFSPPAIPDITHVP